MGPAEELSKWAYLVQLSERFHDLLGSRRQAFRITRRHFAAATIMDSAIGVVGPESIPQPGIQTEGVQIFIVPIVFEILQ